MPNKQNQVTWSEQKTLSENFLCILSFFIADYFNYVFDNATSPMFIKGLDFDW